MPDPGFFDADQLLQPGHVLLVIVRRHGGKDSDLLTVVSVPQDLRVHQLSNQFLLTHRFPDRCDEFSLDDEPWFDRWLFEFDFHGPLSTRVMPRLRYLVAA